MKRVVRLSAIVLAAGMATGCATNKDIEGLQSQINSLKTQVSKASSDAASANAAAMDAKAAANRAAAYAEDTNSKLDRMFKKSMMK